MVRIKRYGVIFLVALFVGIIIGSLFKSSYFNELKSIMDSFEQNAVNYSVYMGKEEKFVFLVSLLIKRGVPFLLLWILAYNKRFSIIYIVWLCISNGFMCGFMCRFLVDLYSGKALAVIVSFLFPQYIFYAAAYVISVLYILFNEKRKKPVICALVILFATGVVSEAYVNPALMCKVFM